MLAWILRPRPYPAFVLLAVIFTIFGFAMRPIAIVSWPLAALLLILFIRGVTIDLSIAREGIATKGRVTRVDDTNVAFTFTDRSGRVHEQTMPFDEAREAHRFHEGSAVKIRYHPRYPDDIWRWLEP